MLLHEYIMSHCMDIPHFVYLFIHQGILGLFPLWTVLNGFDFKA